MNYECDKSWRGHKIYSLITVGLTAFFFDLFPFKNHIIWDNCLKFPIIIFYFFRVSQRRWPCNCTHKGIVVGKYWEIRENNLPPYASRRVTSPDPFYGQCVSNRKLLLYKHTHQPKHTQTHTNIVLITATAYCWELGNIPIRRAEG